MSGGNFYQQPGGYPPPPGGNPQPNVPTGNLPPQGYGPPPQQPSPYPPQAYAQPYGQGPIPGQYMSGYQFVAPEGLPTEAFGGFWLRFVGVMLDGFVLAIPSWLLMSIVMGIGFVTTVDMSNMPQDGTVDPQAITTILVLYFVAFAAMFAIQALYFAIMESKWGGTLGKLALGFRVVDEHGRYPSFGRALGRFGGRMLSNLSFYIGYIIAGFHDKKRSLHDLVAGTYVVRKEYVNPSQVQQR